MSKLVRNSLVVFIFLLAGSILGYILRIFLSRNMTVEDYGLFYSVMALVVFFTLFGDLGMNIALSRFIPFYNSRKEKEKIKSSVCSVILFQIVFFGLITAFILFFSDSIVFYFLKSTQAATVFKILILSSLASIFFYTLKSTFQGLQRILFFSMIETFRILITLISAVLLIHLGVVGVSAAYLISAIATSIVFSLILMRYESSIFQGSFAMKKDIMISLFKFGIPVTVGIFSTFVINYMDTIVLSFYRSLSEVGLYQIAVPTSQMLWSFTASICYVFLPFVAGLDIAKDKEQIENKLATLSIFIFVILIPVIIILFAFTETFITLFFGRQFIEAATTMRILILGSVFYSFFLLFQTTLYGINKSMINTKIIISVSIFNFILNLIMIPQYGIIGASVVSVLSLLIGVLLSMNYLKSYIGIKVPWSRLGKIAACAGFSVFVIFILKDILSAYSQVKILLPLFTGLLVYVVLAVYSKSITKKDIDDMHEIGLPLPDVALKKIRGILK